jgi:hypothetical protein
LTHVQKSEQKQAPHVVTPNAGHRGGGEFFSSPAQG